MMNECRFCNNTPMLKIDVSYAGACEYRIKTSIACQCSNLKICDIVGSTLTPFNDFRSSEKYMSVKLPELLQKLDLQNIKLRQDNCEDVPTETNLCQSCGAKLKSVTKLEIDHD